MSGGGGGRPGMSSAGSAQREIIAKIDSLKRDLDAASPKRAQPLVFIQDRDQVKVVKKAKALIEELIQYLDRADVPDNGTQYRLYLKAKKFLRRA